MHGFNAVIWLSGYKDAINGVHRSRYMGHPEEQAYEAGHAEGSKTRIHEADEAVRKAFVN